MKSRAVDRPTYVERRRMLLVELRLMRLTNPARRVVKRQQRLMRSLRFARREGLFSEVPHASTPRAGLMVRCDDPTT